MKIESNKQFRIYVISWFLVIVGFILLIGAAFIYHNAESFLIDNFKKNKLAQVSTISGLIDGERHQSFKYSTKNQSNYYKNIANNFQIAASGEGYIHQIISFNFNSQTQQLDPVISTDQQFAVKFLENNPTLSSQFQSIDKTNSAQSMSLNDGSLYFYAPIKNNASKNIGLLVLFVSSETLDDMHQGIINSMTFSFSLLSILLMVASILFARKVTGPLELLSSAITRLIQSDFNFKLSSKGFGSFGYLAKQFNAMISRLHLSRNELIYLNKSYSRFVPHQLLKELSVTGVKDISLGDSCERVMTILFCDIRGFTTLSETMSPSANFKFINRYLSQIAPVINKNGGTIDKYLGDGIMALFPNGSDQAVTAAVEMLDALAEYNKQLIEKKLPVIEVGIGLHTGNTMLGTVGTTSRMDATVISDCVNAASRVEAMTKSFCTKILMTEETKRQLSDLTKFKIRYIAECQIKGKSKPVTLYEVYNNDIISIQKEKAQNQALMIKAWKIYINGDAEKAISIYQRLIEKSPHDQSLFALIERCQTGRL